MTAMPKLETPTPETIRMAILSDWMLAEFGQAGAKEHSAFLYQPNFNLGGQTPIDVALDSDTGLQTVKYMLKPISGC